MPLPALTLFLTLLLSSGRSDPLEIETELSPADAADPVAIPLPSTPRLRKMATPSTTSHLINSPGADVKTPLLLGLAEGILESVINHDESHTRSTEGFEDFMAKLNPFKKQQPQPIIVTPYHVQLPQMAIPEHKHEYFRQPAGWRDLLPWNWNIFGYPSWSPPTWPSTPMMPPVSMMPSTPMIPATHMVVPPVRVPSGALSPWSWTGVMSPPNSQVPWLLQRFPILSNLLGQPQLLLPPPRTPESVYSFIESDAFPMPSSGGESLSGFQINRLPTTTLRRRDAGYISPFGSIPFVDTFGAIENDPALVGAERFFLSFFNSLNNATQDRGAIENLILSPTPPWWARIAAANLFQRLNALWLWNNNGTDPWPYIRWIGGPWNRLWTDIIGVQPFSTPLTKFYLQNERPWDAPNPDRWFYPELPMLSNMLDAFPSYEDFLAG
eukprot:Gregarina_sp_Poly_1__10605@NODE_791_length_6269_cov_18_831990_g579_i0_p3_GENE_NODE_791_length_6269_cov_18_831990_g579_i0NODE_791_length_6269_cov_18_831990_g579_i0_p3_ORF_typecomplete_len439_score51_50AATase/PF07247_12/0_24AATase/PF07247_12/3_7e02_NODE_791_length_6269_cov_18_831990_g579_i041125428